MIHVLGGRLLLWLRVCIAAFLFLTVAGCSSPERLPPVPTADTAKAFPLGLANARFFAGKEKAALLAEFEQAVLRQRQSLGVGPDAQLPTANLLALSGGGDNGAFGSGVLVGWTEAGDRFACTFCLPRTGVR
jgi:hypothetical protein